MSAIANKMTASTPKANEGVYLQSCQGVSYGQG